MISTERVVKKQARLKEITLICTKATLLRYNGQKTAESKPF